MKKLLIVLPLLVCSPSCKAVDGLLGLGATGEADKTEQTITTGEGVVRTAGDIVLPGLGGALAVIFGIGARAYVKRRKQVPSVV